jgi:hypothetical protein
MIKDKGFEGVRCIHLAQEAGLSDESRDQDNEPLREFTDYLSDQ